MNNKNFYKNLTKPKNEWTFRYENGYILVSNPQNGILKKVSKMTVVEQKNSRVIKNDKVKNSLTAPIKMFVDITKRCNLRCLHCLSSSGESNLDLSIDTIKEIFNWAYEKGVVQVKLGGGEPILHPNFWEIVDLANKSNLQVSLSTNGCLIDETVASAFKFLGIKVSVSLDGDKENHEKLRGPGVFDKAIECIELLVNMGINTSIGTTIMNGDKFNNLEDIPFLVSLSKKHNIQIKIRRAKPCGRASTNLLALTNPNHDYWKAVDWLNMQKKEGVKVNLEDIMDYSEDCSNKMFSNGFDCGAGTRGLHINSFGVVSPCVFLGDDFDSGKVVNRSDLDTIWKSSEKFLTLRNTIKSPNSSCKDCSRKDKCGGECRAIAMASAGKLNALDPCCPKGRGI